MELEHLIMDSFLCTLHVQVPRSFPWIKEMCIKKQYKTVPAAKNKRLIVHRLSWILSYKHQRHLYQSMIVQQDIVECPLMYVRTTLSYHSHSYNHHHDYYFYFYW